MWVAPLLVLPVHASSGDKVVRTKEDEKGLGAGRGQNSCSMYWRVVVEYGGLDDDDARVPVALAARGSHGKGSRPVLTETFPADPTVHTRATRQEYVNGQLKNKYGDAFVRGNNVLYISAVKDK